MIYGAAQRKSTTLADRIRAMLLHTVTIVPFDDAAAERYGHLRAALESDGIPLAEPDLFPTVSMRASRRVRSTN